MDDLDKRLEMIMMLLMNLRLPPDQYDDIYWDIMEGEFLGG